jgi:hypothetical protein
VPDGVDELGDDAGPASAEVAATVPVDGEFLEVGK